VLFCSCYINTAVADTVAALSALTNASVILLLIIIIIMRSS